MFNRRRFFFGWWRDPGGEPRVVSLPCGDLSRSDTLADRAHHSWQELLAWDALPADNSGQRLEFQLCGPRWSPLRNNLPEWSTDRPWGGQGSVFYRRIGTLGAHSGRPTSPDATLPAPSG